MPLYLVRWDEFNERYDAVSPSKAACKAFHSVCKTHGTDTPITVSVVTEGKRYAQSYDVRLEAIVAPNDHERLHNITRRTVATKCKHVFQ